MASNLVTDMEEWRHRDVSRQMRKQKRNRDANLLKPKGIVFRKKEAPYRRKQRTPVNNIPVSEIRPQIDVYAVHHEIGGETIVFSRDFQEEPLMQNENIEVTATTPVSSDAPSTNWEDTAGNAATEPSVVETPVTNTAANKPTSNVETPKVSAMSEQPEVKATDAPEEQVVEVVQQVSKRSRKSRAWLYGALTTAVVVGSVFAYLRLSKGE